VESEAKLSVEYGYIYVLIDPRNGEVRYIGQTRQLPTRRLSEHIWAANRKDSTTHKDNWIRSLLSNKCKPEIKTLKKVPVDQLNKAEESAIAECRHLIGKLLTNKSSGPASDKSHLHKQVIRSDGVVFTSIKEAAQKSGLSTSATITNCLKGRYKTAGGYGFRYFDGNLTSWSPDLTTYNRPSAKAIIRNDGVIFPTAKAASVALGLCHTAISRAIKFDSIVKGKYKFQFLNKTRSC
jgi:DNA endonuclease I-like protein/GIY-YIG catalytic domain-containing protein